VNELAEACFTKMLVDIQQFKIDNQLDD